jgi:hypothetical protein
MVFNTLLALWTTTFVAVFSVAIPPVILIPLSNNAWLFAEAVSNKKVFSLFLFYDCIPVM